MAVLVEYSDKLQRAVDLVVAPLGVSETHPNARSGRSTFTDRKGGGGGWGYSGPFAFSYNSEGKLVIAPGFLNRNGDLLEIEEQIVDPATGYVCLESHLEDKGEGKKEWTKPAIVFLDKPKATAYPLGKRTDNNGTITTECYEVPMAFILATRQCPLAGGK
jgi:hypothetical protein